MEISKLTRGDFSMHKSVHSVPIELQKVCIIQKIILVSVKTVNLSIEGVVGNYFNVC